MHPTADVMLRSLFVCSSANCGYKGMFSLADILQIGQWRIQGRGPGGRPPPYLRVFSTGPPVIWRSGSLTVAIVIHWVACILAVLAVLGRNLAISSSQNVRSFLWFSSALPKNWAKATESRSRSLFSGYRMYCWSHLTRYLKCPNLVNASLLWRISGEIQANQKRRNILVEFFFLLKNFSRWNRNGWSTGDVTEAQQQQTRRAAMGSARWSKSPLSLWQVCSW